MELNDRKIRILEAIINDYISLAEPIGSRTIAKKYDWGISSATIRNEMSDLEDMGYIVAPHASAGRVPSDKGYRLYVDRLMRKRELSKKDAMFLRQIIIDNINRIDYLMKETAKAIALLTNYTTIVTEPVVTRTRVKHIQLVPYDSDSVIIMLVTDGKSIRNGVLRLPLCPGYETLNALSVILNTYLSGLSPDEIDIGTETELRAAFGGYAQMLPYILDYIGTAMGDGNSAQIYTSGMKNILAFPEFSDLMKARAIFQTLEERDVLVTLLGNTDDDIHIIIGAENDLSHMRDCSVIKTTYHLGERNAGTIGIIGPTRMDYSQAVSVLNGIVNNINYAIKMIGDGG